MLTCIRVCPSEAAEAWKVIQARADRQHQLLVGPAAIRCHSDHCTMDGVQWYHEFFQHCKGCRVDYIATHGYWCTADTTISLRGFLCGIQLIITKYSNHFIGRFIMRPPNALL